MYCICVASVLSYEKVNIEITFDTPPSIAQVMSRAAAAFNRLAALRGVRAEFAVSFAMIFDDLAELWVPLERSTQLAHNSQVYIFQPDVIDVPGHIPEPVSASQYLVDYSSPSRLSEYRDSPRPAAPERFTERVRFDFPTPEDIRRESERRRRTIEVTNVPGTSILREERDNEERKISLPVDVHRETVRRETQSFLNSEWSPSRGSR